MIIFDLRLTKEQKAYNFDLQSTTRFSMPKIVDHDKRRQEIIDAALPYFMETGIKSFTMEELAKRMGIGKGTVYHYFGSKDEILKIVMNTVIRNHFDTIRTNVEKEKKLKAKLRAFFAFHLSESEHNVKMREHYREYISLEMEAKQEYAFKKEDCLDLMTGLLYTIIETEVESGKLHPSATGLVNSMIATADGMLVLSFKYPDYDFQAELSHYLETLIDLLENPESKKKKTKEKKGK